MGFSTASGPPKSSALRIKVLTDHIDDDMINCDCTEGRPGNDQSGVFCRDCDMWQHLNCKIDGKAFTGADAQHGYQCRTCRRTKRSEAAKKGYQKRLIAQDTPQSVRSAPPATLGGRGSSIKPKTSFRLQRPTSGPSSKKLQPLFKPASKAKYIERDEDDDEEVECERETRPGGYSTRSKRVPTAAPYSEPSRKPQPMNKSMADVIEDWKSRTSDTPSKPRKQQQQQQQQPPARTMADVLNEWENKTTQRKIFCDCPGGPVGQIHDYLICHGCRRMQHKVCMLGHNDREGVIKGEFCKECRRTKYEQFLKAYKNQQRQAKSLARLQHHNVTAFCAEVLWKQYCQVPSGEASAAVRELTSMYYDNGRMIPIHPAPKEWVAEVRSRLVKMTAAAGDAKIKELQGPDGYGLRYNEQSMVAWRKLAVWILHHGAYRKNRGELGVLAEVLGLEEKGRVWKG